MLSLLQLLFLHFGTRDDNTEKRLPQAANKDCYTHQLEMVATNIAGGDAPAYVLCALPYRGDIDRDAEWGLDTALAIVEEAVDAFDPARLQARPVRTSWPAELQDKAKVWQWSP